MIDDLCIWKEMTEDSESTTFELVRQYIQSGKNHLLERCLSCLGTDKYCRGYHSRMRFYQYREMKHD